MISLVEPPQVDKPRSAEKWIDRHPRQHLAQNGPGNLGIFFTETGEERFDELIDGREPGGKRRLQSRQYCVVTVVVKVLQ